MCSSSYNIFVQLHLIANIPAYMFSGLFKIVVTDAKMTSKALALTRFVGSQIFAFDFTR